MGLSILRGHDSGCQVGEHVDGPYRNLFVNRVMFRAGTDDPKREYEYAVEAVNQLAAENGWHVISMKNDWERIFDFKKKK